MVRLRVAIVGAGIGREHLKAYLANPGLFEVKVIADLDSARAKPLIEQSGAAYAASLDDALKRPDLDIVDICLPPKLHKSAIIDALEAGFDVVCEKPLVGSLADIDMVEAAASKSGRLVIPVFQYRFGAGLGQLRHLIDGGIAGRPLVATLETHWHRPSTYYDVPWRGKWASELGGAIVGHAIHAHDLLRVALGPIAAVQARLATRVNDIKVEDCAAIIFEMASGALVTSSVTLGGADDRSRLRFCFANLSAESGLLPYNPASSPWSFQARPPMEQADIDRALANYPAHLDGFTRQFELMHQAIIDGTPPPVTLADARASLELITAIYRADRAGKRIELPLAPDAPGYQGWVPQ